MEKSTELQAFNLAEKTAKVKILTAQTAENIIEIGRTLLEVKENLSYGEFQNWLENEVNYSKSTAYNFMKVAKEFPNFQQVGNLGMRKLLALTGIETESREKVIANNDLENMTVKEVEKIIEEERLLEKANRFMYRFSHKIPPHIKNTNKEIYEGLADEEKETLENDIVKRNEVVEDARSEMYNVLVDLKKTFNNDKLFAKWLDWSRTIDDFEFVIGGLLDKVVAEAEKNKANNVN